MNIEILARIRKTDVAELRVTRQRHKGRAVVDLRVWFVPNGQTEYVATRKGVTIDAEKLPELLAALAT